MAANFSKSTSNQPRRGQIKINAVKIIAKSLQNSAIELAGKDKKLAGNGGTNAGGLKSASQLKIKQNRPRRGDVKIRIFKSTAKSVKDFAIGVAGMEKNSAGNGGGCGESVSSPASFVPVETVGGLKPELEFEIKQTEEEGGKIEIDIGKVIGSIFQVPMESGGKKKVAGAGSGAGAGPWAGIVPMGMELEKGCDYR